MFYPKLKVVVKLFCVVFFMTQSFLLSASSPASNIALSPNMQVVLLSKILLHEKQYREQGSVRVFVLGDPQIAQSFSNLMTNSSKHIRISEVASGDSIPEQKYDLIYSNQNDMLPQVLAYAKEHSIVSVTGDRELVKKGVTLGTGAEQGRPHFYLNLSASFATDLEWEQKVLMIVKVYR